MELIGRSVGRRQPPGDRERAINGAAGNVTFPVKCIAGSKRAVPQDDMINCKDLVYFKLLSESSDYVMYVVFGAGMFHVHAARGYVFK